MIRDVVVTGNIDTGGVVLTLPDGTRLSAQTSAPEFRTHLTAAVDVESRRWVPGTVFCESHSGGWGRVRVQPGDRFTFWFEPDSDGEGPFIDLCTTGVSPEGEITLRPVSERDAAEVEKAFPQADFVRGQRQVFRRAGADLLAHEAWTCWRAMEYRGRDTSEGA